MQLTNLRANDATGGNLEPGPCLRRVGAQGVAPRWFERGQAPSGFGKGQAPSGWRPAFLPKAIRDLFDINNDDDDANSRSDLAMQLELRNQSKSTIFK